MAAFPVAIQTLRSVNGIVAEAVLEEVHEDELIVTEHPVEQGSTISDHAYKVPSQLTLTYVWSAGGPLNTGRTGTFLKDLYQKFLQLQVDRVLFDVITGKRIYKNMILRSIGLTTDKDTENILKLRLTCQEIILTTTQTVQLSSAAVQQLPESTAPVVNQGPQSLNPAPNFNTNAAPTPPPGNP